MLWPTWSGSCKLYRTHMELLNGAWLLPSCSVPERHHWMCSSTIQRNLKAHHHQICELLSIIEPPAKDEDLLSNERELTNDVYPGGVFSKRQSTLNPAKTPPLGIAFLLSQQVAEYTEFLCVPEIKEHTSVHAISYWWARKEFSTRGRRKAYF